MSRNKGEAPIFTFHGSPKGKLAKMARWLRRVLESRGYRFQADAKAPRLVLNFLGSDSFQVYRRRAQAVFVISLMALPHAPAKPVQDLYPYLVRSLSNMLLVEVGDREAHFLTLELGHYVEPQGDDFADRLFARVDPMARSVLVIENRFEADLDPSLWKGDAQTESLALAGRRLAEWELLPAPFPIAEILSAADFRHVKRLYGIGGLSYGNLSARLDESKFWMSASGVDKAKMNEVGRDFLLVKDYDQEANAMVLSVPPGVEPRRVSVDAIEHWMIYREHKSVGAIIHVHAWMEGVPVTEFNYPCGTYELGEAVAERIRQSPDPSSAIVGLKNHGLTITGRTLEDILQRIEGRLLKQVPMV